MRSLLEQIKSGVLWDFPGGVFPPSRKAISLTGEIQQLPLADNYFIPVKQHLGETAKLRVKVGDKVLKGQPLTQALANFELPVHAPTSGEIIAIEPHVSAHASGLDELTIKLQADGQDSWYQLKPKTHYQSFEKHEVISTLQHAGVAGLGGAAFPTHIKHQTQNKIELLLINGVECEPYITSDDVLMRQHADEIIHGIEVFCYLLEPQKVVIAVEDNKPEALAALDKACTGKRNYSVHSIPTKYPAGGEKQLIQVLTGREVKTGQRAADLGIVSQNVGTCYAAYKAIYHGEPLIERVVTLTGENVAAPGNYRVRLGTPVSHLLEASRQLNSSDTAQANNQTIDRLIMGGPMMGFTLQSDQVPVTKITNCILAPSLEELPPAPPEQPCIRCGDCADVCPASLLPQQLYWHSQAKEHDKAKALNLFDCIECGACAYVCPSDIPLVQYYRQTKAEIREQEREHQAAEKAKQRFEQRAARLAAEKQARLDKHKKAAEQRKQAMAKDPNQQDKIAAALARVKAQKLAKQGEQAASQTDKPANAASEVAESTKTKAQQAIERAKAKKAAQQEQTNDPVKDRAQAAIERAKAKKAAQAQPGPTEKAGSDEQQSAKTAQNETNQSVDTQAEDPIKARAKAAIERAKAKKAKQTSLETEPASLSTEDVPANAEAPEVEATKTEATEADKAAVEAPESEKAQEQILATHTEQVETELTKATEQTRTTETENAKNRAKKAIAKAKARREKQPATLPTEDNADKVSSADLSNELSNSDKNSNNNADPKAKARAAIERAKARRASEQEQQKVQAETQSSASANSSDKNRQTSGQEETNSDQDAQKQRVRAAIAKAKQKREQKR